MNNKENMLEVSLELFSKRGFSSVSVRDICGELNLKESALYYHFKNKEDILNTLFQSVEELVDRMRTAFNQSFEQVEKVSTIEMQMVAKNFLASYYCENNVRRLISMLAIERLSNETANEKYQKLMYDMPLEQCENVFAQMSERGLINKFSSKVLAVEYLGIIVMAFDRYVLGSEDIENGMKKALEVVNEEIGLFFESICEEKR